MRYLMLATICVALTGCASESVYLRNVAGTTVQCGPYSGGGIGPIANLAAEQRLRDCVADYQRQGYERTPNP